MRKFGIYFLKIITASFLILVLLDVAYTLTYVYGVPRNKVSHLLSEESKRIDYIFLGSSRVDNGIDADIIAAKTGGKAINLGVQGGKIDDFYLMLQLLQKQNIRAKAIFIQIGYIYNMEGNSEILKSSLMPFIHNDLIFKFIKERDSQHLPLKYMPFYRYLLYDYKIGFRELLSTALGKESKVNLDNGYSPLYGKSGKELQAHLPNIIRDRNEKIDQINSFAKANNLKIIYFIAPFCSGTKNLDFAAQLSERLPNFWNFSELFLEKDQFFYDCSHLNNEGATEFSEILAEEIVRNGL